MNNLEKSFKKFLLLWSGNFVSAIGSGLTSFGLGVYVYEQTGRASEMALVTLCAFVPGLLLSAAAGVLADRYDRRILMVIGDGLSALGLIFILLCMLSGDVKLWQICLGVIISSVFSSLLEPSYKATITDLLTKEQFTKASALVQISGSAKYLISPVIAGLLLSVSDIKLLLVIDICTLFVTVISTLAVRKGLSSKEYEHEESFIHEFRDGWKAITKNKGVLILVVMTSVVTFFVGFIQTLFTPMILSFSNSAALGKVETIAASGMLVMSLIIGIFSAKKGHTKLLPLSLVFSGIFMVLLGMRENIVWICIFGFMFFTTLPVINTSLDFLIRTNIENSVQGRAWGLIGVISQLGYVAAYALSGILSDYVFTPLLLENGALANTVGKIIGVGSGRGTGFLIGVAGILLCATAAVLYRLKSVNNLENGEAYVLQNS